MHLGLTIRCHQRIIEIYTRTWVLTWVVGVSYSILVSADIAWLLLPDSWLLTNCCLLLHERVLKVSLVNLANLVLTTKQAVSLRIDHQRVFWRSLKVWVCVNWAIVIWILIDALDKLLQTHFSLFIVKLLLVQYLQVLGEGKFQRWILFFSISKLKIKEILFIKENRLLEV